MVNSKNSKNVKMINLTINHVTVSVPEGSTILDAARIAGIHIPHLCYLKEINEIGACRVCAVEVEGEEKLIPACNNVVRDGMIVNTNTPRVRSARKTNLELILSQHDSKCTTCVRSGNCQLQSLANDFGILNNPYKEDLPQGKHKEWTKTFPLIRDAAKCINCMRCIQVCDKIQGMNVWDLTATGSRTRVDVSDNRVIKNSDCTLCGQCITHCPVGALRERDDIDLVMDAIENPDKITVVQIAPAVRTAWGEQYGLDPEFANVNKLAGALKQLGFDYVFDTSFTADLTIMEEGTEFLHRLEQGDLNEYPMFTSCCPGWVRFVKSQFPELTKQLSTAKSPQQMFGAVTKSYFAEKMKIDPSKIVCVSVMPCLAKKAEADLPTMVNEQGIKDVDYVLTTREILRLIKAERISPNRVWETQFDSLMGDYTGAGVIFGATGGVMEAALRTAYYVVKNENPDADAFKEVRSASHISENEVCEEKPWREATFNLNGRDIRVAVTSGLANARKLCEAVVEHKVSYDFVEVMACPTGCSGGGGQPIHVDDIERGDTRGQVLYDIDKKMPQRFSHENVGVQKLYKDYLEMPNSEKAEKILHTNHFGWEMPPAKMREKM